jgi:hypothetical protein
MPRGIGVEKKRQAMSDRRSNGRARCQKWGRRRANTPSCNRGLTHARAYCAGPTDAPIIWDSTINRREPAGTAPGSQLPTPGSQLTSLDRISSPAPLPDFPRIFRPAARNHAANRRPDRVWYAPCISNSCITIQGVHGCTVPDFSGGIRSASWGSIRRLHAENPMERSWQTVSAAARRTVSTARPRNPTDWVRCSTRLRQWFWSRFA